MPPPAPKYNSISSDLALTSDAEMLLGLQNSPYSHATPFVHHLFEHTSPANIRYDLSLSAYDLQPNSAGIFPGSNAYLGMGGVEDMMIESQEINISTLGEDMMPWYLPQDVLNFFNNGNSGVDMPASGGHIDIANIGNSNGCS
jgi:hypothetical protein